jgi:hypothetical protein
MGYHILLGNEDYRWHVFFETKHSQHIKADIDKYLGVTATCDIHYRDQYTVFVNICITGILGFLTANLYHPIFFDIEKIISSRGKYDKYFYKCSMGRYLKEGVFSIMTDLEKNF